MSDTNILCDGIQQTLSDQISSFTSGLNGASALFEDMTNFARDFETPLLSDLNGAISGLGNAFNMINNGLSFGSLGDMAICLGLSGVGFNLNGSLSTIPDWLGLSLNNWLTSILDNTVGAGISGLIQAGSSLSNIFNTSDIDHLMSLIGCLEGRCAPSYLSGGLYENTWQVEESLNSVGLNLNGVADYTLIESDWNPDTVQQLSNLTNSYNATQSLLLTSQGYDSSNYENVQRMLSNNRTYG